jgi:hypothetical protein
VRLDAVTAEIRPRSDWEAVDLGLALVRRDFWRCLAVWWLALLMPTALAGWWLWDAPAVWLVLFWWWKPAGSRMVLFEISRRLFGERPSWREVWREIPRVWWRRFFHRFVWARFSPWLPVTLAVEDLENLRGKAYRQRCAQVTRRGEGAILWIYFAADLAACWFGLAILVLVMMFIPEGQDGAWQAAMESWDPGTPLEFPALILRTVACCVMLSMSLADLFVTGAGFGVYLNNRTWIEGWDVELALKRLARRLTKAALLWLALLVVLTPVAVRAQDAEAPPEDEAARVIREVKADPVFKVHTIKEKVPVPKKSTPWKWPDWLRFDLGNLELLGKLFVASTLGLLVGLIAWLVWKNRHALVFRGGGRNEAISPPAARVVMGMEVSPETLPADVPAAVWNLWRNGRRQEAMALLYRGAISRVIELGRVEIQESDTEGDCVRRVDATGPVAHPEYFRGITGLWIGLAYAGRTPEDREVEALCREWPFSERREP